MLRRALGLGIGALRRGRGAAPAVSGGMGGMLGAVQRQLPPAAQPAVGRVMPEAPPVAMTAGAPSGTGAPQLMGNPSVPGTSAMSAEFERAGREMGMAPYQGAPMGGMVRPAIPPQAIAAVQSQAQQLTKPDAAVMRPGPAPDPAAMDEAAYRAAHMTF